MAHLHANRVLYTDTPKLLVVPIVRKVALGSTDRTRESNLK
jgi:hypothetical protein